MKYLWMPRLVERIQAASASTSTGSAATSSCATTSSDQFVMASYDDGVNNNNNVEHSGILSNPNGYITSDNSSVAVSPASDLTEYHVSSEVPQIWNNYYPDQTLVGPQVSSQNYLDNSGLLNGDLTVMQEQSYLNWYENINGMIPSYSDSFWNIGSDEDFWLLQQQQQLLDNGSFSIDKKLF